MIVRNDQREAQLERWLATTKRLAVECGAFLVGVSHVDGSLHNCGTSIPLAYCIGRDGSPVLVSSGNVRSFVVVTENVTCRGVGQ